MQSSSTTETVTSADGTPIAYERTGSGPPLVLVHGTAGDRTRWDLFGIRDAFDAHYTVYAVDRRGRGDSGDVTDYALEREFEDVAAVVDAMPDPAVLLGHSHGALCSLEAALRTDNLRRLVLYEPPTPWEVVGLHLSDEETQARMEELLAAGENERVLEVFLHDVAGLPPEEVDDLRAAPSWQGRVDAAHTIPREVRAAAGYVFDPARFADMDTPTLLLSGGESPPWAREATDRLHQALPNSRVAVLEGQGHVAMNTAPERFVEAVLAFVDDEPAAGGGSR